MKPNPLIQNALQSGRIKFVVEDLSRLSQLGLPASNDGFLYPRRGRPTEVGILYFAINAYHGNLEQAGRLSEAEFNRLPAERKAEFHPVSEIHVSKATWEVYKDDTAFIAQIVVDAYNQIYPERAVDPKQLWSDRANRAGVSDLDLFFVDHAVRTKNSTYLQRLAGGISQEEDPQGNLARAAKEGLERLGLSANRPS